MRRSLRAATALFLSMLVLTTGAALPSSADKYSDQRAQNEAKQAAIDKAMSSLKNEIEGTSAALVQAYAELQGLTAQVPVAQQQLATAETHLATVQREAALINQQLDAAEAEAERLGTQIQTDSSRALDLRAAIGQMARDAYKGDLATTSFTMVLDATSTQDYIQQSALAATAMRTQTQALREVEQIVASNRNAAARQSAVEKKVTELKTAADAKVVEAADAKQAAADRSAQVTALLADQKQKTAAIEAQKKDQLAQQAELAAQQAQLENDLKAIIKAQEAARIAAGKSPIGSTASQPFINPTSVNPIVKTSPYGLRFHPILHIWVLHSGVDLQTFCDTKIYAGAAGTVVWTKYNGGHGNQVMLNNGYWNGKSLMSSYSHLTRWVVSPGQQVSQGQLIAYSGTTGMSTGCHLHFEVYINGSTVDPWPMIAK